MGRTEAQARGKPTELVALTMTEERKKEIDEICDNLDKMQKLKNKGKKPQYGAFGMPLWNLAKR